MVFASSDAGPWWGGSVQVLCRRRGLLPALAAFLLGASLLLEGIPDVIGHTPVVGGGGDAVGLGVLLDFLLVGFQPGLGWRGRCRSAVRGWRLSVQSFRRSGGRGIVPVLGELPDVVNASDHGWGSGALGRLRRGRVVEASECALARAGALWGAAVASWSMVCGLSKQSRRRWRVVFWLASKSILAWRMERSARNAGRCGHDVEVGRCTAFLLLSREDEDIDREVGWGEGATQGSFTLAATCAGDDACGEDVWLVLGQHDGDGFQVRVDLDWLEIVVGRCWFRCCGCAVPGRSAGRISRQSAPNVRGFPRLRSCRAWYLTCGWCYR